MISQKQEGIWNFQKKAQKIQICVENIEFDPNMNNQSKKNCFSHLRGEVYYMCLVFHIDSR